MSSVMTLPSSMPASPSQAEEAPCCVLIIDNYDSFTYNIREMLAKIGVDAVIVRNDAITIDEVASLNPSHIIISPGPGTPENPEDIGITDQVIDYAIGHRRALLGVCLGHQALAHHFDKGKIIRISDPRHGKRSEIRLTHQADLPHRDLFDGMGENTEVMRYHSLVADHESLSPVLRVTAETRDCLIMAVQHQGQRFDHSDALPIYGVQFHPESFATPEGEKIMRNFLSADVPAYEELLRKGVSDVPGEQEMIKLPAALEAALQIIDQRPYKTVEFPCTLPPEDVHARLHAAEGDQFCLESIPTNGGEHQHRHSFFGRAPRFVISARNAMLYLDDQPVALSERANPMMVLDAVFARLRAGAQGAVSDGQSFSGGLVGFTAYEAIQYTEPKALPPGMLTPEGQRTFSYGYYDDGLTYDNETHTYRYFTRREDRSEEFRRLLTEEPQETSKPTTLTPTDPGVSQGEFERQVEAILGHVRAGETFQTVLSRFQRFAIDGSMEPIYRKLRELYPSGCMHAIRTGNMESIGAFPELVLMVEGDTATTYQIAGTRRRVGDTAVDDATWAELIADPKERAEHEMLVDLARNDLARSVRPGSVEIDRERMMIRLNAGHVMHIATAVRGRTNGHSPLRTLLSILPMGTVSGAPKVRSMKIIAEQERVPRGLYAGSFGFMDVRGGLRAVVGLRSFMRVKDELTLQSGAGIVFDSDPAREYQETMGKMANAHEILDCFIATTP